jgi:hypothetical protein
MVSFVLKYYIKRLPPSIVFGGVRLPSGVLREDPRRAEIEKTISITIDYSIRRLEEYNSRVDKPREMSAFGVNIKVSYVH